LPAYGQLSPRQQGRVLVQHHGAARTITELMVVCTHGVLFVGAAEGQSANTSVKMDKYWCCMLPNIFGHQHSTGILVLRTVVRQTSVI